MGNEGTEIVKYQDDFTEDENLSLQTFIKKGCPGLTKVAEVNTFEWFQLYMAGKSYGEIANSCNTKKDLVLYMSNKLKWNEKRMSYYSDITSNLIERTKAVKVESAGTIATMVSALNQYFGEKFTSYLKTKDASYLEGVDVKMLGQYYKSLEILDKLMGNTASDTKEPLVNINLGSSAKIEQNENGSVVVTDNSAKEIMSLLAQYKKRMSDNDE
jgi:hypothetical protein